MNPSLKAALSFKICKIYKNNQIQILRDKLWKRDKIKCITRSSDYCTCPGLFCKAGDSKVKAKDINMGPKQILSGWLHGLRDPEGEGEWHGGLSSEWL